MKSPVQLLEGTVGIYHINRRVSLPRQKLAGPVREGTSTLLLSKVHRGDGGGGGRPTGYDNKTGLACSGTFQNGSRSLGATQGGIMGTPLSSVAKLLPDLPRCTEEEERNSSGNYERIRGFS